MSLSDLLLPQHLRRDLVAYWPLASASAIDLKSAFYDGRGPHDLTKNNAVTRAAGPSNNLRDAAQFANASSQTLSVSTSGKPSLVLGGKGDFEITGWVNFDNATGTQSLLSHYTTTANQRSWWLLTVNGTTSIIWRTDAAGTGGVVDVAANAIGSGVWAFFDVYFDSRRGKTGISVTHQNAPLRDFIEADQSTVFPASGSVIFGGRAGPADMLDGRLAAVKMHLRLLTHNERLWLYNTGLGRDLTRGC